MSTQPPIMISQTDMDRIERVLETAAHEGASGVAELEQELERAKVVSPQEIPPNVVTMNSTVRFREVESSKPFELTLVYPKDVDPAGKTVSILAPVGSALLGLSEGDEIEWPRPAGGTLRVRIEQILYQPERAGEHHR